MRKEQFVEGEFYHVYNRGVDRRLLFLNDKERFRFVHTLYILNNFQEIPHRFDMHTLSPQELLVPIQPYVEISAACLMSNHYHLLLTPKRENGISIFLHKIGTSYTMYFNKLHERTGRLFENTFKARLVDRHEYASYLTYYIHFNPAEMFKAKPRTPEILQQEIELYPWSTLPDYLGKKSNLSILVSGSFRDTVLGMTAEEYRVIFNELFLMS